MRKTKMARWITIFLFENNMWKNEKSKYSKIIIINYNGHHSIYKYYKLIIKKVRIKL